MLKVLNIMQGQRYIEICERNPTQEQSFMDGLATGSHKVIVCKRTKLATFITLLCILFSGCTAHSINNNIQVSLCVKAI